MKLEKNQICYDTGTSILFVSVVLTYLYFTKIFSSKMYAQYAQSKIVRFDCMYGTYRTYLSVKRRFKVASWGTVDGLIFRLRIQKKLSYLVFLIPIE